MKNEISDLYLDLIAKKATCGLDEAEEIQLQHIDGRDVDEDLRSFEITAAAINMAGIGFDHPLPQHLYSKIAADARQYIGAKESLAAEEPAWPATGSSIFTAEDVFTEPRSMPWMGWLGWVAAAAACIALALNIWLTRTQPSTIEVARTTETAGGPPKILTPAEAREEMLASAKKMVKAIWSAGNMKDVKQVSGDVVWSDEMQAGYMRLRGLPANDPSRATYQLWIFDKTQDKTAPIDGGTFDVNSDGEVVIPINAKLKAAGPEMFAITMEKPGGVVVSKREKVVAIAKVETQTG
jgi:Anti-sigma-K factor rskA